MYLIAIVEDSRPAQRKLADYVNRYMNQCGNLAKILYYDNGLNFLDEYPNQIDIVFLDIDLPHMDGLEVAKRIRAFDTSVCIIFTTSMSDYAIQCYKVRAFGFLVKPIRYEDFEPELHDALHAIQFQRRQYIQIKSETGSYAVNIKDILYFESAMHKIYIKTQTQKLLYNGTLKSIEAEYHDVGFFRSHAGYLVNGYHIQSYDNTTVTLLNGEKVPISRAKFNDFTRELTIFLGGQI